jgi:hypothetical protein
MKRKRNLFILVIFACVCGCIFWISRTNAVEKSVEVNTYSLPEYRTDTARAIDAYQQMINRMLDQNEKNTAQMNIRLAKIEASLARIETHLGIKPMPCAKTCNKKPKERCCVKQPQAKSENNASTN